MRQFITCVIVSLSLLAINSNANMTNVTDITDEGTEISKVSRLFNFSRAEKKRHEIVHQLETVYVIKLQGKKAKKYGKSLYDIVGSIMVYEVDFEDMEINKNTNSITLNIRYSAFTRSGLKNKFGSIELLEFMGSDEAVFYLDDVAEIEVVEK